MRESVIEAHLVKRVNELGGEVRKVMWIGRRGAPDRLAGVPGTELRPPRHAYIELKAPGIEPEPHQLREHARMRRIGLTVLVIDSIEGVDEWLGS